MRKAIPARTQDLALKAANGLCGLCGGQLKPGQFDYDHKRAVALGGTNDLDNVQVICRACHVQKTHDEDRPAIGRADRKGKATRSLEVAAGMSEIQRRFR